MRPVYDETRESFMTRITICASVLVISAGLVPALAQTPNLVLLPYATCRFQDGLEIVNRGVLPPSVTSRPVETDSGTRQIDLQAGIRIMFAYPNTDFYANTKVELLPADKYPKLKKDLLDNFQHAAHGNTVNSSLLSPMNGLEIHGLDREKLEGGVLGVYLFFDDASHVVTTIYLLNQEPQSRKFKSIEEYRTLRDRFLSTYTGCVRANLHQAIESPTGAQAK
jgi:hypothetical protein